MRRWSLRRPRHVGGFCTIWTEEEVARVYDEIADEFSRSRNRPWPWVERWVAANAGPGLRALDVGCGNGRHAEVLEGRGMDVLAVDLSARMARLSSARLGPHRVVRASCSRLPLQDASFDVVLCVAVLHHLPDRSSRAGCLAEIGRVLAPGGRALVSVWSERAPRFASVGPDQEVRVPFGSALRPYHLYTPGELEGECDLAGLLCEPFEEGENLCATVRRLPSADARGACRP